MKLKKVLAAGMSAAMVLSLAACGGSSSDSGSSDSSTAAKSSEKYSIGICQMLEHPALDAATEGFQDAVNEKFGEGNVSLM